MVFIMLIENKARSSFVMLVYPTSSKERETVVGWGLGEET